MYQSVAMANFFRKLAADPSICRDLPFPGLTAGRQALCSLLAGGDDDDDDDDDEDEDVSVLGGEGTGVEAFTQSVASLAGAQTAFAMPFSMPGCHPLALAHASQAFAPPAVGAPACPTPPPVEGLLEAEVAPRQEDFGEEPRVGFKRPAAG